MEKVKETKYPTYRQVINMVFNLTYKFGLAAHINIGASTYTNDHDHIYFSAWLHPGDGRCYSIESWSDLQNKYFELMEE